MNTLFRAFFALSVLTAAACVDHRDTRTEIFNEYTYLPKDFVTRPNPRHEDPKTGRKDDRGWLMGVTVTAVSVPTAIPDIFPGLSADTRYVQFVFTQDSMQIVDGIVPGPYGTDGNLVDPASAADLAPRMLQEYPGTHVDVQLRKDLDGEVTNYIEENRERDWMERQFFKPDFKSPKFSDLSRVSWYDDWGTSEALQLVSTSVVPGSIRWVDTVAREAVGMGKPETVDWDRGDYLEWTIRASYKVLPFYGSLMVWTNNVDTQTVDLKYSLWRRPDPPAGSEYVARPIGEKDEYRRQFGVWDYILRNYQDPDSGFIGTQALLSRFNPNLPIDYYLVDVPKEFESVYDSIATHTNAVFAKAGVKARVAFHKRDEGGIRRDPGDIRYNFVWWHNNDFSDVPWLGYGPSFMDPRTGEIVSATLNFNNWHGLHWYTQIVRDLLEQVSDAFEEGAGKCTPGELRPVLGDKVKKTVEGSTLFSRMESYMGQSADEWVVQHDENWFDDYHLLLQDIRWYYPPYQSFVQAPRDAVTAAMRQRREALMAGDRKFWEIASRLDSPFSPTGTGDFSSPQGMAAAVNFLNQARESMQAHRMLSADRRIAAGVRGIDLVQSDGLLASVADISQRCKPDGTWQTLDEWEDDIRWRIAHQTSVHELGHDLGLYHNFYGSVDRRHFQTCTGCKGQTHGNSSSVMDYVHHFGEVNADLGWYPYDIAALLYAYRYDSQEAVSAEKDEEIARIVHPERHDPKLDPANEPGGPKGKKHLERSYLYANDYHEPLSPLVKTFDLGVTPTQMVKNAILYYDWMYKFRNFRSYRQYWETWDYPDSAFEATFPLRRLLELWAMDFTGDGIENRLRLMGVEGDRFFFDTLREEFAKEMGQANRLAINFFRAILTQSNAERSYMTTYDPFFGDVTRIGIIYDKFYAMMSFLGLWPADWYDWNDYAYLAYYDADYGSPAAYSDAMKAVDEMLGGSYDVYPWFLPLAVLVFAQDTHDINFGDQSKKEWIAFRAFDRSEDLTDYFGFDPRSQCAGPSGIEDDCPTAALGAEDDGHQVFRDAAGGQWAYLFLKDRNQHLAASADISPIAFKLLWDFNEAVNIQHSTDEDTITIKYFLDFYRYFN